MLPRAWRPAIFDEEPKRKGDGKEDREKFSCGTHAEPGHRQRVRLLAGKARQWADAVYDRVSCSFWIQIPRKGWAEVPGSLVHAWTQNAPGSGFTDPAVN